VFSGYLIQSGLIPLAKDIKGNILTCLTSPIQPQKIFTLLLPTLLFIGTQCLATTYPLPAAGEDIVGELQTVPASRHETLLDIALHHDLGHEEIVAANPGINPWLPQEGALVTLPTQFILPNAPRQGIVINLPEMRLYYYPEPKPGQQAVVVTHPISIGSEGRNLPMGISEISEKRIKPSWRVPASIRAEHAEAGDPLPAIVPAGPDNPLGDYAMRLGTSAYLIHGTNRTFSIGMRVSHGCIRLYPNDIESLFAQVPMATPVRIINQPFKAGWLADELYVEAHAPLRENKFAPSLSHTTEMVSAVINASHIVLDETSWAMIRVVAEQRQGAPTKIVAAKVGESLLRTVAAESPGITPGTTWWLQIGAYRNLDNAKHSADRIGEFPAPISTNLVTNGHLCHVVIGPFAERDTALNLGEAIRHHTDYLSFPVQGTSLTGYRYCQPNT